MRRLCISEIDHDASIALFEDDQLLAALSEERLSRVKLHAGFPTRAVEWALAAHPGELDEICIAKPPMAKETRLIGAALREHAPWRDGLGPISAALDYAALHVWKRARTTRDIWRLNREIDGWAAGRGVEGRLRREYNHHFLHAASAYYGSGWEDALAVTADGQGGGVTASVYACRAGKFERLHEVKWPHSMGAFYASVTRALGFKPNRHEGKITGLAGYEPPAEEALAYCRGMARSRGESFTVSGVYGRYPELMRLVRRHSPGAIAAAFQIVLEEVLRDFTAYWLERTGLGRVVLAGGVFANVKLNQRIAEISGVEDVFVFPGMADVGLCWGLGEWESRRGREFAPRSVSDVYWGPSYSEDEIAAALRRAGLAFRAVEDVGVTVGDLLADGHVVSRFDGRMEFGPRALGNRSMLFHTRDRTVNDWLNKLLHRTEFMPFAPVTLAAEAPRMYRGLPRGRRRS